MILNDGYPRVAGKRSINREISIKVCGISGIVTQKKLSENLKEAVRKMNAAQIHRGPDGTGAFVSENVALAMRRLSIIDLEGGGQPLYNEDKSLALIINGEIYNYRELRDCLQKAGHRFRTETDGEVILHLYEENNSDFVTHLRGMFAFALWDSKRRRLILARDRMGEKPLYLFERDGEIVFASELKGLMSSGLIPFALDSQAINLYFHYQYVPEPLTPINGVRKLDAAHLLVIDVENWRIEEKKYWRMEDAPLIEADASRARAMIKEKLEEVNQLIVSSSDVPIGVALSGGLDSSIIAAFATRQRKNSLCAFSVGYAGRPECDERDDAARLALHLNLPFYETELDTQTIVDFFPQLNYWRDDPIADIAGFGYYAVMKLARDQGVPVLLQGQGGDELFWGYPQLRAAARETRMKAALRRNPLSQAVRQSLTLRLPDDNSSPTVTAWARDIGGLRSGWRNTRRRQENPSRMIFYDLSPDFAAAAGEMRTFYAPDFIEQIRDANASELFTFTNGWQPETIETTLTKLICDTYLRENGITQGDRLGMASSVEMRLPLIDYKFVETVVGLRKSQPDSTLAPKHLLREAVRNVLPEWVLNRPKRGFAPPVREWHAALFKAYGDDLREGCLVQSKILQREGAARLAKGEFPADATSPLSFKALVLEQWCRQMRRIVLPV